MGSVLIGGINFFPVPNFGVENFQVSVVHAENKTFAAKDGAMTDVELIEAQAKEASRLRAIEAVKEKIASYVRNFSEAKGKLSEDDIAAIAEKFEQVGETKYQKLFYNAVDEEGKELGKVGIMYEATVTAKFNSKRITEHIKLTEQEKAKRIRQARESREKFEELDREYEELRKNARTKTPEQLQAEIKDFDDKLSDLEKRRNQSGKKNKPVKKDKPTAKQDKIQPMKFSTLVELGTFGWTGNGGIYIKDATYVSEQPKKIYSTLSYSKGTARFGKGEDALYLHYDKDSSPHYKLGSQDIQSTIVYAPVDVGRSSIFKVNVNNGYLMYLISKNYDIPEPRKQYVLIGRRPDGKWVKYFDTDDLCNQYIGKNANVAIQKITSNGDTIIAQYARCNYPKDNNFYASKVNERGEFRFKWDEAAKWFGVEKIIYNQTPTVQKPTPENKPATNQPMQFSQPVQIGRMYYAVAAANQDVQIYDATYKASKSNGTFKGDIGYSYDRLTKFGNNDNSIYVHHKTRYGNSSLNLPLNFGDKSIKNTIELKVDYEVKIFQIKNNSSIKFYILKTSEGAPSNIVVIGNKNGEWIKYFEIYDIIKRYCTYKYLSDIWAGVSVGNKSEIKFGNKFKHGLYCDGDTIVFEYEKDNGGKGSAKFGKDTNEYGEFRFKWDEKAQWFSVEQIKY